MDARPPRGGASRLYKKKFFSRNEENRGDKRIGDTGRVSLMRQPPAFGLARIFEMTPERLLNIMRNSIKSVVSALLTAGERPTMRIVAQACAEAGISPPANEASLAAMVSLLRRELGLSAIRTRREPTPAVVEDHHDHHEHDHEEAPAPAGAKSLIPASDPTLVIDDDLKAVFNALHTRTRLGHRPKALVAGPAGCGKSSLAREFAARTGRPFFEFSVPNIRESRDWFGSKGIGDDNRPKWFESLFVRAIRTEGAVILLDEVNRCATGVANVLLPLLDHRASTYFEEMNQTISCAKHLTWFGTANEGRKFGGTFALDAAFKDRLSTRVEVTYLPQDLEANLLVQRTGISKPDALRLVEIANITRTLSESEEADALDHALSTRALIESAHMLACGGPRAKKTLLFTVANHYPAIGGESSQRAKVLSLIIGKFGDLNG